MLSFTYWDFLCKYWQWQATLEHIFVSLKAFFCQKVKVKIKLMILY